ncbi:hypothetical protein LF599_02535 [Pseudodesulfovibrio thermohalotolerans]|uniref:hypothetical protein n=1 Tax=Pseudodesulfovibrio thermohalotolerans TaxID=2880651 RepID=UPI0024421AC5|nr:hypothetical protein [Pseudodesulfovibrio thermohalotolerans]WFS63054.1 hypothetical protein LF599_02535 [Pseudodesulfovibrio thermohalotolerans]
MSIAYVFFHFGKVGIQLDVLVLKRVNEIAPVEFVSHGPGNGFGRYAELVGSVVDRILVLSKEFVRFVVEGVVVFGLGVFVAGFGCFFQVAGVGNRGFFLCGPMSRTPVFLNFTFS